MTAHRLPALASSVLAAGLLLTTPAAAADGTALRLGIHDADGQEQEVTLECEPTGGTHPEAAEACAVLIEVNGQLG